MLFSWEHLNIKTDILGHILVPVVEGPGEGEMCLDIAAALRELDGPLEHGSGEHGPGEHGS